jgi:hypothetical protein
MPPPSQQLAPREFTLPIPKVGQNPWRNHGEINRETV